jgi:ATP-dependent DNA helicase RecG
VAATLDGFALADLDLQERREGDVLGDNQSGRPTRLRFLSLAEHLDLIVEARELCESVYAADPDNSGMAVLAGQFTGTDRIDYLHKA